MRASLKSAYILELTPRAPRVKWGELRVLVDGAGLKLALEEFGRAPHAAFHVIISGATLGVWVVQRGVLTDFIDLHPFIRADLGSGARTLDELWSDERALGEWGGAMDDVDPWLEHLQLEVFWDPIAEKLPLLEPPCLAPDESVPFEYGALATRALTTRLPASNPMKLGTRSPQPAR